MGKQRVKSNHKAMKKLMEKSAAEKVTGGTDWSSEGFTDVIDLAHALNVVTGTEWDAPLTDLVTYLMGLWDSLLVGKKNDLLFYIVSP
jgi:hypothetical protein